MEIKNNHAISISNNQPGDIIWKIKLDDASKIMVWEIRNSSKKLSFGAYDFAKHIQIFNQYSFADEWNLGLDFTFNGIAYYHGYENEFSPVQKGIIAFDVSKQMILWQNFSVGVQQFSKSGIVVFDPKIFPRNFQLLNFNTGELISKINNQDLAHHAILDNQIFLPETNDAEVIWETTQTLQYKNYRIISFYHTEGEKTNQYLEVYKNENLIFKDLIHLDIQKLSFDTFFLWHDHLIYIKNKSEILTYLV
jgi:hypothetical protein